MYTAASLMIHRASVSLLGRSSVSALVGVKYYHFKTMSFALLAPYSTFCRRILFFSLCCVCVCLCSQQIHWLKLFVEYYFGYRECIFAIPSHTLPFYVSHKWFFLFQHVSKQISNPL